MPRLLLALLVALTCGAQAKSLVSEITPTNHEAVGFTFAVSHKRLADGGAIFTIAISEKGGTFSSVYSTKLAHLQVDGGLTKIDAGRTVPSTKQGKAVVCVVGVSKGSLTDSDLCFIFTNPVERIINGESVFMPAVDSVCVRLKAFFEAE